MVRRPYHLIVRRIEADDRQPKKWRCRQIEATAPVGVEQFLEEMRKRDKEGEEWKQ